MRKVSLTYLDTDEAKESPLDQSFSLLRSLLTMICYQNSDLCINMRIKTPIFHIKAFVQKSNKQFHVGLACGITTLKLSKCFSKLNGPLS